MVALDVFRKMPYPKREREVATWIGLLATETLEEAQHLIAQYPWLEEIYAEMAEFAQKPEAVLTMFSDALKILDRNTVQFMIDELAEQVDKKEAELKAKQEELQETEGRLDETQGRLNETQA